ncbi:MAG: PA2779 family protein [Deltaproteobacteria bacterium]|nr:PA2779 family protein [Deltaproteobacteria bacterium]
MKGKITKWVTWYMVTVMFLIGINPRVYAGFSPSETITLSPIDRHSDLQKIQKVLESKMIHERLRQLGFHEEGIQKRLNRLTDEQIHQLALKLDELKVGGDSLGIVIAALLVAVIAVLIVYLLGYRLVLKSG